MLPRYTTDTGADTIGSHVLQRDCGEFALLGSPLMNIHAIAKTAKKELQTKLDNHLVQIEKWRTSSKNLFRLIDSSIDKVFRGQPYGLCLQCILVSILQSPQSNDLPLCASILETGKVNIPPARPQPVLTGKPKVPAPVLMVGIKGLFLVPTVSGYFNQ
ncbi:hypothetical protein Tco_0377390 [Tanacetum coccineum]